MEQPEVLDSDLDEGLLGEPDGQAQHDAGIARFCAQHWQGHGGEKRGVRCHSQDGAREPRLCSFPVEHAGQLRQHLGGERSAMPRQRRRVERAEALAFASNSAKAHTAIIRGRFADDKVSLK